MRNRSTLARLAIAGVALTFLASCGSTGPQGPEGSTGEIGPSGTKAVLWTEGPVADPGKVTVAKPAACVTSGHAAAAGEKAILVVQMGCVVPAGSEFRVAAYFSTDGGTTWTFGNGWYAVGGNASASAQWVTTANRAVVELEAGKTYLFATEADHPEGWADSTDCQCNTLAEVIGT